MTMEWPTLPTPYDTEHILYRHIQICLTFRLIHFVQSTLVVACGVQQLHWVLVTQKER